MTTNLEILTYPTTPDTSIAVGDFVRSYDFPTRTDCFVLGGVSAIRGELYIISVAARVFENVVERVPGIEHIGVQVNGTGRGWAGVLRGVVKAPESDWNAITTL